MQFVSPVVGPTAGILIRNRVGNDVFATNNFYVAPIEETYELGDEMVADFNIALNLGPAPTR